MESSGIQVILPNMIEFIPMIVAFTIVAIVLWKFGWPKFEGMLEARKTSIESALKDSEEKRIEAENLLQEYKQKLQEAEATADEIVTQAKLSGIEIGKKIEQEAKDSANRTAEKAKLSIEQKQKVAEHDLKTQAVDVALTAVKKFVSSDLSGEQHRKIIEKYINEAGSLKA